MKVRYGKPIKAKSMLFNSFSREVSNSGSYALVYKNWGTGADVEFGAFTEADYSHKFFCYTEFELAANNFTHTGFAAQGTSESTYKPNNYSLCSINKPTANSVSLYVYGTLQNPITVKTRFMIDLTELGLDNLTAEEFYNRYKGKFGLLATGEEITLDRKVGKIQDVKSAFDGYTEVEYLESTSTQYIDTKYIPNQNTKIIFDTKMSQIPGQGVYPRQGRYGEGQRLSIYLTPSITEFAMGDYKQLSINAWNQRHAYELDVPNLCAKLDGEVVATFEPLSWTNQQSLYLFARHVNTSPYYDGNGNITNYNIKIYESNILVHNFIPCIRNNDNTPGMYDLVDGIFYTNQGTGTFIAGPAKSLPSEYQQVEYIESDGNQYLSVDVGSFNANFKLDIDFQQTSSSTSEMCLFGNSGLEVFTRTEGFGYWTSSNGSSFATNYASLREQRVFASIDNSNGKMQVNSVVTTYAPKTVSSYTSINVFRYAYSDRYLFVGRIFYLKLYTGNKYIELIPCYRKSDNVIGMYDLVGKQFYMNQGTGTFLKGQNVANIISCKVAGGSSDIYYGYNQLCFPIQANLTGSGTTWTETPNGFLTTSSSTGGNRGSVKNVSIINGHKYYIRATLTQSETGNCFITIYNSRYSVRFGDKPVALTSGVADSVEYMATSNFTDADGIVCFYMNQNHTAQAGDTLLSEYINVIDLTDWYGAGKEPSTVEEFKEKFAKEYYGFCKTPIKLTRYQIEALPNYGYNQYAKNGDLADPAGWGGHGGSSIAVSDGIATITASTSSIANFGISRGIDAMTVGHKIFASCTARIVSGSSWVRLRFPALIAGPDLTSDFQVIEKIGTVENSAPGALLWQCVGTGNSAVVQFKNIYIIDLTDWYGEGNEPTTVEEFKQTFPNKYYPYSKKRLLNKYMINKLVD